MSFVTAVRFSVRDALIRCPLTDRPRVVAAFVAKWLGVALVIASYAALAGSLEYAVTDEMARRFGVPSREIFASLTAALVVLGGIAVAWNVRLPALVAAAVATIVAVSFVRDGAVHVASWATRPSLPEGGSLLDLFANLEVLRNGAGSVFDAAAAAATGHAGVLSGVVHGGGDTPLVALIAAWIVVALAYAGWLRAPRR